MRVLIATVILINITLLTLGVIYLPVHWDEGWNLCVARYWFEDGHYGCKYLGNYTTARLSTGWVPVAITRYIFELTGVTYIAGRIGMGLLLGLALLGLYLLTKKLADKKSAIVAVILALALSPDARLNPILLAAQAFSEVATIAFLVWGFYLLAILLDKNISGTTITRRTGKALLLISITLLFFLAIRTKAITTPFLLTGLGVGAIYCFALRKFLPATYLILITTLVYLTDKNLNLFYYPNSGFPLDLTGTSTTGLKEALGFNPDLNLRKTLFLFMFKWYWLFIPAAAFLINRLFNPQQKNLPPVQITMLFMFLSWSSWFFILSIDFPRYYAIPAFLFMALLAPMLLDFLKLAEKIFKNQNGLPKRAIILVTATYLFLQLILTPTLIAQFIYLNKESNKELLLVAKKINTLLKDHSSQTTDKPFLETYESQIFHLLDIPYRYPPDQINVEAILADKNKDHPAPYYSWDKPPPRCVLDGAWSSDIFSLYKAIKLDPRYKLEREGRDFRLWCAK